MKIEAHRGQPLAENHLESAYVANCWASPDISDLAASKPRRCARLRRDFARYCRIDSRDGNPGTLEKLRICLDSPGLQALVVYRFGSWVNRTIRFKLFRIPLKLIYYVLDKLTIIFWGIHIDEGADIGGGFYIGHCGGVLIGPARIGFDCSIGQQVAIGRRADGVPGVPTLGNRVWVGAGSILFGGITIGEGATIGPLTVVSRNLPPRILVIGNPMKVLRRNYDNSTAIDGANPVVHDD
jgi:serine O-acetyltransferase